MSARVLALAGALILLATAALANHPGARLNEVMAAREPAFEALDHLAAPDFDLATVTGTRLQLSDFDSKVLVLSFVEGDCDADCVKQQAALTAVQKRVNIAPMPDMVQFVTIVAPGTALPEGAAFGPANWQMLTAGPGTSDLAATYTALSTRPDAVPMTFMVDRVGRISGIFHSSEFGQVNMLLYINGLANDHEKRAPSLWQRLWGLFW